MRAGLSSNPLSTTLTASPARMLAIVGAENSQRVLLAMASNSGVKLCLVWLSSDFKAETFLSLALVLLINASDLQHSLSKGQNRSYITLHKIHK
jgi:hypothetical protein